MRKKLLCSSVVVAASLFASSANAAQFMTISGPSGVFGDDDVICSGPVPCSFTRSFNFLTPVGFNIASADISSIASTTNMATNIDFSSVTLNGVVFNTVLTGTQEFRNLLNQNLVTGANNLLSVTGTSGGNAAFSGNLSFASAIPEPATWMMMLLGFAGIGFTMRRKNKSTLQVRYT